MSHTPNEFTSASSKEWEEARGALSAALKKYSDLSDSLGARLLKEAASREIIGARIDTELQFLRTTADSQMSQARASLSRTRNRFLSPTYRLPDEVLSEIFGYTVFSQPDSNDSVLMGDTLSKLYRSLHSLASVSYMWRIIALTRAEFWSIVPMIDIGPSPLAMQFNQATQLSIQRSMAKDLYLAAIWGEKDLPKAHLICENATRFRTVNITAQSCFPLGQILTPFLWVPPPRTLAELSMCLETNDRSTPNDVIQDQDYLFPFDRRERELFDRLVQSLSVFRISGVRIYWRQIVFSEQLVELHLQDITFDYDGALANLLSSLKCATRLRELSFISVMTLSRRFVSLLPVDPVNLPSLQSLLLRDLCYSALVRILNTIASRSHKLKLHLTRKCVQYNADQNFNVDFPSADDLCEPLEQVSVETLLLDGDRYQPWLTPQELSNILGSMTDLATLRMDHWVYNAGYCRALRRPQVPNAASFPQIKFMYFSWARIEDEWSFRTMAASHSEYLEKMYLGAALYDESNGLNDWVSLEGHERISVWLKNHVRGFGLDHMWQALEFQKPKWQLW